MRFFVHTGTTGTPNFISLPHERFLSLVLKKTAFHTTLTIWVSLEFKGGMLSDQT